MLVACGDTKTPPKARTYLALLGNKSEAVLKHVESTCTGRVIRSTAPGVMSISCHLSDHVSYSVVFEEVRGRIRELEIEGTLADALPIYDRAFAPIVPDETRVILRTSLREPQRTEVFRKSGGEVAMYVSDLKRAHEGHAVRIAWSMVDLFGEYAPIP